MTKTKKILLSLIGILAVVGIIIFAIEITNNKPETNLSVSESGSSISISETVQTNSTVNSVSDQINNENIDSEHPKAPELDYLKNLEIPEYDGKAYIMINDGIPFFDTSDIKPESYEIYYDLDELGRCTLADAVVGQDLMPTEKRGDISSVKPTGWHKSRYPKELVDGESLYNRCHLIAFGMCGETANKYNLVTGTRYFNTKGVNNFENMVIDYVRETNEHVRYRVTPVWTGDNLICDGEIVEAWSVEDNGEAICFCIYAYNVQPGIVIDYATGDNWLDGETKPEETETSVEEGIHLLDEDIEGTFILNIKKKKIHTENCSGANDISEKNKEIYTGSYNELIKRGFVPDKACFE